MTLKDVFAKDGDSDMPAFLPTGQEMPREAWILPCHPEHGLCVALHGPALPSSCLLGISHDPLSHSASEDVSTGSKEAIEARA